MAISCDPNSLAALAKCFKCLSPGTLSEVQTYLLCQILNNGGTGGGGGGSGTVTSFSSGNLSPLFTTSVATATTTPALTFALSNAAAFTVLGNPTNAAAGPVYTSTPQLVQLGLGVAPSGAVPLTILVAGIAAVSTDGVFIENTTAATGAVQIQKSPAIHLKGFGWKTNAGGASEAVEWQIYGTSITGAADPIAVLNIDSSVNGAAFVNRVIVGSDGSLNANQINALGFFSVLGTNGLSQTFDVTGGDTQITFTGGIATGIA